MSSWKLEAKIHSTALPVGQRWSAVDAEIESVSRAISSIDGKYITTMTISATGENNKEMILTIFGGINDLVLCSIVDLANKHGFVEYWLLSENRKLESMEQPLEGQIDIVPGNRCVKKEIAIEVAGHFLETVTPSDIHHWEQVF
jgi:hypothetical protein